MTKVNEAISKKDFESYKIFELRFKYFVLKRLELSVFLPLITVNCAVLGVALLNTQKTHNFFEATLYGFGGALGFSIVLILFSAMRERLAAADVPLPFKGAAIGMITAGLMSLAFMGFTGLAS